MPTDPTQLISQAGTLAAQRTMIPIDVAAQSLTSLAKTMQEKRRQEERSEEIGLKLQAMRGDLMQVGLDIQQDEHGRFGITKGELPEGVRQKLEISRMGATADLASALAKQRAESPMSEEAMRGLGFVPENVIAGLRGLPSSQQMPVLNMMERQARAGMSGGQSLPDDALASLGLKPEIIKSISGRPLKEQLEVARANKTGRVPTPEELVKATKIEQQIGVIDQILKDVETGKGSLIDTDVPIPKDISKEAGFDEASIDAGSEKQITALKKYRENLMRQSETYRLSASQTKPEDILLDRLQKAQEAQDALLKQFNLQVE